MPDLCIQIHPHRSPDLDVAALRADCERIAHDKTLVTRFAYTDGTDGHYYINLMFESDRLEALWRQLHEQLYRSETYGAALRGCSMAMCEGEHGWDDYLLLCHFDPKVQCEGFS